MGVNQSLEGMLVEAEGIPGNSPAKIHRPHVIPTVLVAAVVAATPNQSLGDCTRQRKTEPTVEQHPSGRAGIGAMPLGKRHARNAPSNNVRDATQELFSATRGPG